MLMPKALNGRKWSLIPCSLNLAPRIRDHASHDTADVVSQLVEVGHCGGVQQLVRNLRWQYLTPTLKVSQSTIKTSEVFSTFLRVATAVVSTPLTATEVVAP